MQVIYDSFTLGGEQLKERAKVDFALDKVKPSADGVLKEAEAIKLDEISGANRRRGSKK